MSQIKKLVFSFLLVTITLKAQTKSVFEEGKLFARVKMEFVASFSANEILTRPAFAEYGISIVRKAFKINEEPLNRVYLIEFNEKKNGELLIKELQQTGLFDYVEKVAAFQTSYTPNDLHSAQWNLKKIAAEKAWDIKKGNPNIIIAIVDDAMDTLHPDLEPVTWRNKNEIRGNSIDDDANGYVDDYIGWDCADYDNDPTPGGSVLYHGTHCAGIAGAATNNSKGIASIGFGCRLMVAKIGRPANGQITLWNAYEGVEYAIINKANVISMSWGGPGYNITYQSLFDIAYKNGIVCVAAAGNDTDSSRLYPAAYNHVIAVGSTTSSDKVSVFSNFGTWIDVMAPGSGIYSTLPNNKYGYLDGTSMACPLVSGLCGLMLSKNPYATPDEIEACLKSGCENINSGNSAYIGFMGAGRINAENSMKCIKPIDADFTSSMIKTCPGDTIQFFDKSLPKPVAVKWKFTGGSPASSFSSNPKVIYNSTGSFDVELIAFDSTNSDTLLMKNYVTIVRPTAVLSLNRTISPGITTSIRIDFTGTAPYKVTIFDGTSANVISNITNTPYYYFISPTVTTTYILTSYNDKRCSGTVSGTSKVTVVAPPPVSCLDALRYQANLGGSSDDNAYGITEDSSGNIYISGNTLNYGSGDGYFAKYNKEGNMVWFKTYGGSSNDLFQKHIMTPDKGFLLVGNTYSYGAGGGDVWIVKVDSSGTVQWSKTVGGSGFDFGWSAAVTIDKGYYVYGHTASYGAGNYDNYLIRLDKSGNLKWTKTYGNANYNTISGLVTYADGSSVFSSSYRTTPTNNDNVLVKIDSLGNVAWSKKFGGSSYDDVPYAMTKGSDNNLYIAGLSNQEMLLACFTPSGNDKWMKLITGSGNESLYDIERDGDNLITVGYSNTYGSGGADAAFIKFDTLGNIIFTKIIGGTNDEFGADCIKSIDDGYYMIGHTKSFSNGGNDIFINKFNCKPEIGCNEKNYNPSVSSVSLSISSESQSISSGGSLNSQTITATIRSLTPSFKCKIKGQAKPQIDCIKVENYSKLSATSAGFSGVLDDGDYFGQTVRNFGDFDGDGIEDLIVGAQNDDDGGSNLGAVYIVLLKNDGSIKSKQKISASSGGFNGNLTTHNYFGSGVAKINDLDGDGVNDLVVGHIYDNTGYTRAGAVWIIFLNNNGTVKSYQKIANGTGGFPSVLDAEDNFGCDVNALGDMDGDGNTDIIVGAPYDDDGGADRGAVYIIYLNSNGTVKSYKKISSTTGGFSGSIANGDHFGYSVSVSGDLNNDSIADIAVGARSVDDGGTDRGAAWLLFLNSSQTVIGQKKISSTSGSFTGALDNGDNFGNGIEIIKDINGDGNTDLAVSAPYDDDKGADRGAVWLLHLDNSGNVKSHVKISALSQTVLSNKIDNDDLLGWRVSFLNDIDANGYIEILAGAMKDDDGGTDRGSVYIFNLGDTCRYKCITPGFQSKISGTSGGFNGTLANGDGFGGGVNGVGDIDSDGIPDMAVSAASDDDGSTNAGAVWILFMKSDGSVKSQQKISATAGGFGGTITNGNYFGNRIVPLGDLNFDGVPDIAVSHHFDNSVTTRAGAIWILFLNSNGTVKSYQKITAGVGGFKATLNAEDRFGLGLESIGDFDGDGVVDLLAGAQEDKDGGSAKGAFYILYLKTDGTVKSYSKISATKGNFSGTLNSVDRFGFSLTSPGDIDKDGTTDFIVGSRDDGDGGPYRGAIWTLFMNPNGTVKSFQKNSSTIGALTGIRDNDQFGQDMRTISDLDNDGINEIVVSAAYDDNGGTDRGAAWIIFLNNSGKIKNQIKISSSSGYLSGKLDNSDLFGYGVGVVNDLNGDGYKEIAVGAYFDDDGGTDKGGLYILNIKDTCTAPPPKLKPCRLRADFSYKLACLGDTFKFFDASIDNAKAGIIKWNWSFGDGSGFEDKPDPSHFYNSSGTYLVKLVVHSNGNPICADSITRPVKVNNQLKVLGNPDDTICISDSAVLGVGKILCGVQPYTYLWQPSTGLSNDKILFPKASPGGTTKYILTITDKNNQKVYDTLVVKVDSNCCRSYANFITNGDFKCEKDTFIIGNQSTIKLGVTYNWRISTGGNYTSYTGVAPPPLVFNKAGSYSIRLIVNDICGADTMIRNIHVYPAPKVNAGRDTLLCVGDSVTIGTIGLGMNGYVWSPSTGLNSHLISQPTAYFKSNITYILKMTTDKGCKAYDTISIGRITEPVLNIGPDTMLCPDTSFTLRSNLVATSYLWNTGSPQSFLKPTFSDIYWLEVKTKCVQRDSATITFLTNPQFSLGRDTILCDTSAFTLKPDMDASTYIKKWDNGDNTDSRTVNKNGTYWLKLSKINCTSSDTIHVEFSRVPAVDLGSDTTLCSSGKILLNATDSFARSYLWNDGDTSPVRQITTPGGYRVTLKNQCGTVSDSIHVDFMRAPVVDLGPDTVICSTGKIVLNATDSFTTSYLWNDGDINPIRQITAPGGYSVTLNNKCGTASDSINLGFSRLPYTDLGPDTVICSISRFLLDATDSFTTSYLWNDGNTNPIRQVTIPGRYSVTLTNSCGSYKAFINIGIRQPPIPYLGDEITMCKGDTITLNATNPNTDYYLWNDGSVKSTLRVTQGGKYTVMLGNICGDFDTSVLVKADNCDCEIFIPNSFTPVNTSGINDLFKPVIPLDCEPTYFQMNIYNRWGEIIFTTNDYNESWNGEYKGRKVQDGTYTWIITLEQKYMNKGKRFSKTGHLIIIE